MPAYRPVRRAAFAALAVGSLLFQLATPAAGQTPAPPTVALELIGQPVWHGPEDPLDLRLRVSNNGLSTLDGFRLQVRAFPPASSRSELHENFEIDQLRVEASSLPIDRLDLVVPAGTSTDVSIEAPVSALTSVVGGPAGVYPITITVTDVVGSSALDSTTTQLLYFPEEVEVPLNVVVLWPLIDIPSRHGGGSFEPQGEAEDIPLEIATSEEGWLSGILDALEADFAKGVRLGWAPGPRLVEELADMADGYRVESGEGSRSVAADEPSARAAGDAVARLKALAAIDRLQPMRIPYAFPDLTTVDDFELLSAQLNASRSVLEERLGISPDSGWLFSPGGRLDEVTLERLRSSDAAASTFFAPDTLEPEPLGTEPTCRQDFIGITYTCPVRTATAAGRSRGFVLDLELQRRLGALVTNPSDVGEMQKFFAELAMIWAELPTPVRVIPVAMPPMWHPPSTFSERFVRTMAGAPWIRTRTPRGGLHLGIGTIPRELVTEATPARLAPDDAYLDDIDEAADIVESFARMRPPISLVQRLRRDVLTGHSLLWWGSDQDRLDEGAAFAADARREAEAEFDKISIAGKPDITLASRRGSLPLSLQNSADYPVTLEVHLESRDRDLDLSERSVVQTFEPGATPLSVQVSARASGIYPVGIRVLTSDGYEVSETSISIRSTEFNEIALAITVGALVFLVGFSTVRGVRRRRRGATESETQE